MDGALQRPLVGDGGLGRGGSGVGGRIGHGGDSRAARQWLGARPDDRPERRPRRGGHRRRRPARRGDQRQRRLWLPRGHRRDDAPGLRGGRAAGASRSGRRSATPTASTSAAAARTCPATCCAARWRSRSGCWPPTPPQPAPGSPTSSRTGRSTTASSTTGAGRGGAGRVRCAAGAGAARRRVRPAGGGRGPAGVPGGLPGPRLHRRRSPGAARPARCPGHRRRADRPERGRRWPTPRTRWWTRCACTATRPTRSRTRSAYAGRWRPRGTGWRRSPRAEGLVDFLPDCAACR